MLASDHDVVDEELKVVWRPHFAAAMHIHPDPFDADRGDVADAGPIPPERKSAINPSAKSATFLAGLIELG